MLKMMAFQNSSLIILGYLSKMLILNQKNKKRLIKKMLMRRRLKRTLRKKLKRTLRKKPKNWSRKRKGKVLGRKPNRKLKGNQ